MEGKRRMQTQRHTGSYPFSKRNLGRGSVIHVTSMRRNQIGIRAREGYGEKGGSYVTRSKSIMYDWDEKSALWYYRTRSVFLAKARLAGIDIRAHKR